MTPSWTSQRPFRTLCNLALYSQKIVLAHRDMGEGLFRDKKILVMGLGRFGGGVDVAKFACSAGAKVIVTDLAKQDALAESISQLKGLDVEYHLGSHDPADFEQADIVVGNPAVPLDNKFLQIARKAGRKVTSQIELFFELCPAKIIGITGANGKSTTTDAYRER